MAFLLGPGRIWLLLVSAACLALLLFGVWVGYRASTQARADTRRRAAVVDGATDRIAAELVAQLALLRWVDDARCAGPPRLQDRGRARPRRAAAVGMVTLGRPSGVAVLRVPAEGSGVDAPAEQPDLPQMAASRALVVEGIGPALCPGAGSLRRVRR